MEVWADTPGYAIVGSPLNPSNLLPALLTWPSPELVLPFANCEIRPSVSFRFVSYIERFLESHNQDPDATDRARHKTIPSLPPSSPLETLETPHSLPAGNRAYVHVVATLNRTPEGGEADEFPHAHMLIARWQAAR